MSKKNKKKCKNKNNNNSETNTEIVKDQNGKDSDENFKDEKNTKESQSCELCEISGAGYKNFIKSSQIMNNPNFSNLQQM